ncbi:FAD/NAD(P)-binding protein [Gordonia rubripertincta]|uniref:FAD/NAD(P)-binding protein n=1 Tax=Gordonia rubripertincta TaxID=36822 RepID=A0AAW4GBZ4_GORRU|nr:FAD/NAD(P)-binding protein [Gordonia rubripertincta]MBM7280557.1 FAD/NAD(P)-binding protein [Gordonia rubripertincta]
MRVIVVGAGAAGSLVVFHLARLVAADDRAEALEVVVVDPTGQVAGPAFGTKDPAHLLNVPAAGMSVDPDERFDFVDWCRAEGLVSGDEAHYFFAPRAQWARYLRTRLAEACEHAGDRLSVRHVRESAVGVTAVGQGVRVTTSDGTVVDGDRLVLATGLPGVGDGWAPCDLSDQPRYVANPWRPDALEPVMADDGDVLVIGTGLTMVDVAISLLKSGGNRRVEAISRGGRFPRRHADTYLGEVVPDTSTWGDSLDEIRAAVATHVARIERLLGNWRPGVDGVRYRVAELWARLDEADRGTFVRELAGDWLVRRHRMPPSSGTLVDEARRSGRLVVRSGRINRVDAVPGGLTVTTGDDERTYAWIVNCTGPQSDVRELGNPVLDSVLDAGLATTDALGLGLVTDDGHVLDADGHPGPIWTLGSLRRGELWETTAVPEIRTQAEELAASLIGDVTSHR